jgi:hypothetical protein
MAVGVACLIVGYGIGQKGKEPELKLEPLVPISKLTKPRDPLFAELLLASIRSDYSKEPNYKFGVTHKNGFVIVHSKEGEGDMLDGESSALFTESGNLVRYHVRQQDDFAKIVTKYKKEAEGFNVQWLKFIKSIK